MVGGTPWMSPSWFLAPSRSCAAWICLICSSSIPTTKKGSLAAPCFEHGSLLALERSKSCREWLLSTVAAAGRSCNTGTIGTESTLHVSQRWLVRPVLKKSQYPLQKQIIWSFSSVNREVYNTGICLYSFCIHDIWSSACHHLYPGLSELLCHSFNHFNRGLSWSRFVLKKRNLQQNRCILSTLHWSSWFTR